MKIGVTVLASAVLIIVTAAGARFATGDSCKLGKGFVVLPDGQVETAGELIGLMEKGGSVDLDLIHMTASYDLRITYRGDGSDSVHSFKESSQLRRITTKPDDEWMCAEPKRAKKDEYSMPS